MLIEMSSIQLSEWMAFEKLEPFGFQANLYGHAMNAAYLMNLQRKKGSKPIQPMDLMPKERSALPSSVSFFQGLKDVLFRAKQNGK